jgi:hypothetical protein
LARQKRPRPTSVALRAAPHRLRTRRPKTTKLESNKRVRSFIARRRFQAIHMIPYALLELRPRGKDSLHPPFSVSVNVGSAPVIASSTLTPSCSIPAPLYQ